MPTMYYFQRLASAFNFSLLKQISTCRLCMVRIKAKVENLSVSDAVDQFGYSQLVYCGVSIILLLGSRQLARPSLLGIIASELSCIVDPDRFSCRSKDQKILSYRPQGDSIYQLSRSRDRIFQNNYQVPPGNFVPPPPVWARDGHIYMRVKRHHQTRPRHHSSGAIIMYCTIIQLLQLRSYKVKFSY